MLKTLLYIGLGSFAGGILRYLIASCYLPSHSGSFPWGTFIVNSVGCFLIGILYGIFERYHIFDQELRLLLTVGFCGSFTTFSTFMYENVKLLGSQQITWAIVYTAISLLTGFIVMYIGNWIIQKI